MTPNMILDKKFDKGMSGYKVDEVNTFLNEIYDYVITLCEKNQELEEKMAVLAEKLEEYKEDEDSLRAALIGAHKLGETVVRESKKKAEAILRDADLKSDLIITRAKTQIDKEAMALATIQREVSKFKSKLLSMYKQHLELINTIPNVERPELSDILSQEQEHLPEVEEVPEAIQTEPEPDDTTDIQQPIDSEEPPALEFTEIDDEDPHVADEPNKTVQFPHRKKGSSAQKFGTLRFGEGYDLTRHE